MFLQCDGKQPVCGRCLGYGHQCRWEKGRKGTLNSQPDTGGPANVQQVWKLNSKLHRLITILESVRDQLPAESRTGIERELQAIRNEAKDESAEGGGESPSDSHQDDAPSERYLGEASDIVFYNTVKQSLNLQSPASGTGAPTSNDTPEASYEQLKPNQRTQHELSSVMPSRATTNRYLDIYFTTIHIAYPFLPQALFEEAHNEWWQSGSQSKFASADTWLALMCMFKTRPKF